MFKPKFLTASLLVRQFCYQSDISLSKLYPNSPLKLTTPALTVSYNNTGIGNFNFLIPCSDF